MHQSCCPALTPVYSGLALSGAYAVQPAFRVKQDAVPGMLMRVWFEATQTGDFALACAELCGNGHTTMGGTVTVLSVDAYQDWLVEQSQTVASR